MHGCPVCKYSCTACCSLGRRQDNAFIHLSVHLCGSMQTSVHVCMYVCQDLILLGRLLQKARHVHIRGAQCSRGGSTVNYLRPVRLLLLAGAVRAVGQKKVLPQCIHLTVWAVGTTCFGQEEEEEHLCHHGSVVLAVGALTVMEADYAEPCRLHCWSAPQLQIGQGGRLQYVTDKRQEQQQRPVVTGSEPLAQ